MSRKLPQSPNLDHLRKQAKALLRELQRRKPGVKLTEVQRDLARQYGFASWNKLRTYVESQQLPGSGEPAEAATAEKAAGSGMRGGGGPVPSGGAPAGALGPLLFARFSERARRVIFFARYRAWERGSAAIESEHLLLALIDEDSHLFTPVTSDRSLAEDVRKEVEERTPRQAVSGASIPLSDECRTILEQAAAEADRLHQHTIQLGHFLLGILQVEGAHARTVLKDTLGRKGITLGKVRKAIVKEFSKGIAEP